MYKNVLFISILLLLTSYTIFAQDLVSKDPLPRNVVLEEFTGIYCGFCPEGHKIAKELKEANPGRVVLINIHEGSFAVPQTGSGHPDFQTPWGTALQVMSNLVGYPAGMINRQNFVGSKYNQQNPDKNSLALNRAGWAAAAADVFADANSPVNIGAKVERMPGNKLKIYVELYYTSSPGQGNKLNVALLENGYVGYQAGSLGGENYEHNHILRDLVTGQWGEYIKNTTKGTLITRTYEYDITSRVDPILSKLEVAVFVTKNDNSYIYTGINADVPEIQPTVEIVKPEIIKDVRANSQAFTNQISVKNITANPITFDLTLSKSARTPSDWTTQLGSNTTQEMSINPGETKKIEFSLTPSSTIGLGDATLTIQETNTSFLNYYTHTISCISKEMASVEIISQSEISTKGLKSTLKNLGYNDFFELQVEDFTDFISLLTNLKTVIWNYSATLYPGSSDFGLISDLSQRGVNQFICGNLVSNFGSANLDKLGLAPLGFSTQGYGSSPWLVWLKGVPNDPISGNITADIEGNLISYLINVYTVTNSETTKPFLTFKNTGKVVRTSVTPRDTVDLPGSDAQFGFRITGTNYRTVFMSLCPFVFKQTAQRNLIIDNVIKWLNGINDVEELTIENSLIYPNPSQNIISLNNDYLWKPYQIISTNGVIVDEGKYSGLIQISDLNPGTYFLNIDGRIFKFIKI